MKETTTDGKTADETVVQLTKLIKQVPKHRGSGSVISHESEGSESRNRKQDKENKKNDIVESSPDDEVFDESNRKSKLASQC